MLLRTDPKAGGGIIHKPILRESERESIIFILLHMIQYRGFFGSWRNSVRAARYHRRACAAREHIEHVHDA